MQGGGGVQGLGWGHSVLSVHRANCYKTLSKSVLSKAKGIIDREANPRTFCSRGMGRWETVSFGNAGNHVGTTGGDGRKL